MKCVQNWSWHTHKGAYQRQGRAAKSARAVSRTTATTGPPTRADQLDEAARPAWPSQVNPVGDVSVRRLCPAHSWWLAIAYLVCQWYTCVHFTLERNLFPLWKRVFTTHKIFRFVAMSDGTSFPRIFEQKQRCSWLQLLIATTSNLCPARNDFWNVELLVWCSHLCKGAFQVIC